MSKNSFVENQLSLNSRGAIQQRNECPLLRQKPETTPFDLEKNRTVTPQNKKVVHIHAPPYQKTKTLKNLKNKKP